MADGTTAPSTGPPDAETRSAGESSLEETIQDSVVTVGTEIVSHAANDFYANAPDRLQGLLNTWLSRVATRTPAQQFAIGLGTGWVSGYLFRKVSRTAAFIVGCGFLTAQAASSLGFITVDWNRVRSLAAQNLQRFESTMLPANVQPDNDRITFTDRIMFILETHMYISSGFLSGLTIALTF